MTLCEYMVHSPYMLGNRIARSYILRPLSAIVAFVFILNDFSFAASEPAIHLAPPSKFKSITDTRSEDTFLSSAAFREINILIGRYLRIGVSAHTLKKHIAGRIRAIKASVREREPLRGFAFDELGYDGASNSFKLPLYRNGALYATYRYSINNDRKDAVVTLPLGDGTNIYIKIDRHEDKADREPPPTGSIYSVFDYLSRQPSDAAAEDAGRALGRFYDTIKYDLRALHRHLRLIDRSGSGRSARYSVPAIVKNRAGEIKPVLELFDRGGLRPTKAALELTYEVFLRSIFTMPEIDGSDSRALSRIEGKLNAFYDDMLRFLRKEAQNGAWMKHPAKFAARVVFYRRLIEMVDRRLAANFRYYHNPGDSGSNRYMGLGRAISRLGTDLNHISFKANRFLQNGEFDALFDPIRGKEAEFRAGAFGTGESDETHDELKKLFTAVVDRLETHFLIQVETEIDYKYRHNGPAGLKGKVALLGEMIDTMRSRIPDIDIEPVLEEQFRLARQAEDLLREIKSRIYSDDMNSQVNLLSINFADAMPAYEKRRAVGQPDARSAIDKMPDGQLKKFMIAIESHSPGRQPEHGSPEERLLELTLPQLILMMGAQDLRWPDLESLTRLANREWERLGSIRRVWADENTGTLRINYMRPGKSGSPNIESLDTKSIAAMIPWYVWVGAPAVIVLLVAVKRAVHRVLFPISWHISRYDSDSLVSAGGRSVKALKAMLTNELYAKDTYTRAFAASTLGKIGTPDAIRAIVNSLGFEKRQCLDRSAGEALINVGTAAIPALREARGSADKDIAQRAAGILDRLVEPKNALRRISHNIPKVSAEEERGLGQMYATRLEKIDEGLDSVVYRAGSNALKVYKRFPVEKIELYRDATGVVKRLLEPDSGKDEIAISGEGYKVYYVINPIRKIFSDSSGKTVTENDFIGSDDIGKIPEAADQIKKLLARKRDEIAARSGIKGLDLFFPAGTQVKIDGLKRQVTLIVTDVCLSLILLEMPSKHASPNMDIDIDGISRPSAEKWLERIFAIARPEEIRAMRQIPFALRIGSHDTTISDKSVHYIGKDIVDNLTRGGGRLIAKIWTPQGLATKVVADARETKGLGIYFNRRLLAAEGVEDPKYRTKHLFAHEFFEGCAEDDGMIDEDVLMLAGHHNLEVVWATIEFARLLGGDEYALALQWLDEMIDNVMSRRDSSVSAERVIKGLEMIRWAFRSADGGSLAKSEPPDIEAADDRISVLRNNVPGKAAGQVTLTVREASTLEGELLDDIISSLKEWNRINAKGVHHDALEYYIFDLEAIKYGGGPSYIYPGSSFRLYVAISDPETNGKGRHEAEALVEAVRSNYVDFQLWEQRPENRDFEGEAKDLHILTSDIPENAKDRRFKGVARQLLAYAIGREYAETDKAMRFQLEARAALEAEGLAPNRPHTREDIARYLLERKDRNAKIQTPGSDARKMLSQVKRIDLPKEMNIQKSEQIPLIVEEPLVAACQTLFRKGIRTLTSSANATDIGGDAYIAIDIDSLSEENRVISEHICKGANSNELRIPVRADRPVSDISREALDLAEMFVDNSIKRSDAEETFKYLLRFRKRAELEEMLTRPSTGDILEIVGGMDERFLSYFNKYDEQTYESDTAIRNANIGKVMAGLDRKRVALVFGCGTLNQGVLKDFDRIILVDLNRNVLRNAWKKQPKELRDKTYLVRTDAFWMAAPLTQCIHRIKNSSMDFREAMGSIFRAMNTESAALFADGSADLIIIERTDYDFDSSLFTYLIDTLKKKYPHKMGLKNVCGNIMRALSRQMRSLQAREWRRMLAPNGSIYFAMLLSLKLPLTYEHYRITVAFKQIVRSMEEAGFAVRSRELPHKFWSWVEESQFVLSWKVRGLWFQKQPPPQDPIGKAEPSNIEADDTVTVSSERTQAIELVDAAKIIGRSADTAETITVGLGTSWMAAYDKSKSRKYQDLNKLIIAIGRLLKHYNIDCVAQQAGEADADFAKRIDANNGRVIVLTGLNTIVREDSPFAAFRDKKNVFLAGVDTEGAGLDENCYLPIAEMLKLALYIGLKDMLNQDASSDNITTEPYRKFTNVFRFLPRAVRIPVYENLRALYITQEFA